jgi:hypothetical protein
MGLFKKVKTWVEKKEASGQEYVKWLNEKTEFLKKILSSLSIIIRDVKSNDEKELAKELNHVCNYHLKTAYNSLKIKKFLGDIIHYPDINDLRIAKNHLEDFTNHMESINEKLEKCEFEGKNELKHILVMRYEEVKDIYHETKDKYDKFKRTLIPF